jgi:hypothetical protein
MKKERVLMNGKVEGGLWDVFLGCMVTATSAYVSFFWVGVHNFLFLAHPATIPGHMATIHSPLGVDRGYLLAVWVTPTVQVLWDHHLAL